MLSNGKGASSRHARERMSRRKCCVVIKRRRATQSIMDVSQLRLQCNGTGSRGEGRGCGRRVVATPDLEVQIHSLPQPTPNMQKTGTADPPGRPHLRRPPPLQHCSMWLEITRVSARY